jgi:hypothetical protein
MVASHLLFGLPSERLQGGFPTKFFIDSFPPLTQSHSKASSKQLQEIV